nr:hypothetical protein PanWU01x14_328190 [Ipomoea trifida]
MQQADRTGVEAPARASHVVAAEAVLVPPVIDRLDFPAKNQQKWRERAQLVHAPLLLDLHPRLDLLPVIPAPPFPEVHHHHAGVEVAGVPGPEYPRENRVGPELFGEVFGEIGVAVFRGPDDPGRRENGLNESGQDPGIRRVELRGEEMEKDALRARRVSEHRVHRRH